MTTAQRTTATVRIAILASLVLAAPFAIAEPADHLTIATWNIEHLGTLGRGFGGGYGGFGRGAIPTPGAPLPLRSDADLEKIAHFIRDELGADLLAIQEIGITSVRRGRSVSRPLSTIVNHLNMDGEQWVYFLPQVNETPEEDAEDNAYLGYLWNQKRVKLLSVFEMSMINQGMAGKELFDRTPLIGYFETPEIDGMPGNDFALVNVHLASGQNYDENHLIAMTLIEATLSWDLAGHAVSESDIIILGDFNDNPAQTRSDGSPMYSPAMHEHMRFKGYLDLVLPAFKTTRMNTRLDSLIDHILVNKSAQADLTHTNATIYKPGSGPEGDPSLFPAWRKTYSDHFPLSFGLKIGKDTDADFFE